MILDIFSDIWSGITNIFDELHDLVMTNYDQPFLWIIIFGVLLAICYAAISNMANK